MHIWHEIYSPFAGFSICITASFLMSGVVVVVMVVVVVVVIVAVSVVVVVVVAVVVVVGRWLGGGTKNWILNYNGGYSHSTFSP